MEQQRLHTSFSKICEEQYALDRESENPHDMRSHYASADPHDLHASAAECSFIAQLAQTVDARTVIAFGSDNEMEVQYLTETLPSGSLITVVIQKQVQACGTATALPAAILIMLNSVQ